MVKVGENSFPSPDVLQVRTVDVYRLVLYEKKTVWLLHGIEMILEVYFRTTAKSQNF